MCDAKYCSALVNVGNYGKEHHAQVFNNSDIGRGFRASEMKIHSRSIISGHYLTYLIISDEICAHRSGRWSLFLEAFDGPQAVFNYWPNRALRTIKSVLEYSQKRYVNSASNYALLIVYLDISMLVFSCAWAIEQQVLIKNSPVSYYIFFRKHFCLLLWTCANAFKFQ